MMAYAQLFVAFVFVSIHHACGLAGIRESVKAALDQTKDASQVFAKDSSRADASARNGGSGHVLQKDVSRAHAKASSGADGNSRKGVSGHVLQKDTSRVHAKDSSRSDGSARKGVSGHVLQKDASRVLERDSSGADGNARKGGLLQRIMGGKASTETAGTESGAPAQKSSLLQRVLSMGAKPAATGLKASGLDNALMEDSATEGVALVQTQSKLVLKRKKEEL